MAGAPGRGVDGKSREELDIDMFLYFMFIESRYYYYYITIESEFRACIRVFVSADFSSGSSADRLRLIRIHLLPSLVPPADSASSNISRRR